MYKLGLDFGTTNSTLSYLDPTRKVLECYRMREAGGTPYIPSFISYGVEDDSIGIGKGARFRQGDDEYLVYSKFKMLLAEKENARLEDYGYGSKTPSECAKMYIEQLLRSYCDEQNIKDEIESIVISVPEIWIKEGRHSSRECLKKICSELNLPLKRFISEPVAASAYFSHCFKEHSGSYFNGHVLVCDYGGGTLDLSLSHIEGERITVMESTGKGHDDKTFGKAGVAFDEAVISTVYERKKGERLERHKLQQFFKLADEFEEKKVYLKNDVDKALDKYIRTKGAANKKIFEINSLPFMASDFVESFDNVIKPDLLDALTDMKGYLKEHGVDDLNKDRFRVVMAGGFSGFYLVQNTIRKFFESETKDDQRFNSCFTVEDTALAIAKGAALVANDMVSIDPRCPISVGLKVKTDIGGFLKDTDVSILKKGIKVSEYRKPVFLRGDIEINVNTSLRKTPIILFLGDEDSRRYVQIDKAIDQIFPNISEKNNLWKVGFSVDEDLFFTLHVEDKKRVKQETHLGDLLERVSGLILVEEE